VKKTPNWAPWITVLLGLFVSWFMLNVLTPQVFAQWIGIEPFTRREATDMNLILTIGAQVFITGGFFALTSLFYKEPSLDVDAPRKAFFKDLETPVIADGVQSSYDRLQRRKLGVMVISMGVGLCFMAFIPNPLWGRIMFISCALTLLVIGALLKNSAGSPYKEAHNA